MSLHEISSLFTVIKDFIMSLIDMLLLRRLLIDRLNINVSFREVIDVESIEITLRCGDRTILSTIYNNVITCNINPFTSAISTYSVFNNEVLEEGLEYNVSRVLIDDNEEERTIVIDTTEGIMTLKRMDNCHYCGTLRSIISLNVMNDVEVFKMDSDVIMVNKSQNRIYIRCLTSFSHVMINLKSMEIRGIIESSLRVKFLRVIESIIKS